MSTTAEQNYEIAEFLKNHSIFQVLEMHVLESLSVLFNEIICGPGHIIFKEGDKSDGMYVVKSGSVAVLKSSSSGPAKVIAYLTAGECFGEMAELNETVRTATIRVPEEATVLRLPTVALREVTRKFPAVFDKIADIINRREAASTKFKPPGLQGNLAFFDLPTVIQTVAGSRQDGILSLFGQGRTVGRVVLRKSTISSATFEHLRDEYALYELMNSSDPLDFTFEPVETHDTQPDSDLARRPPHMLLIEGARRADELPKLLKNVGWPSSIYSQLKTVPDLAAFGPERRELVRKLWNLIEMGCNCNSICKQVPYDRYAICSVLDEMINAKWISKEAGPSITEELRRRTGQFTKPSLQDLKAFAEGKVKQTSSMESPFELVRVINSLNGMTTNMGQLYGKVEVRMLLQEALAKVSKIFPVLAGLKVHIDSPCLDMRSASSEFSSSPDSIAGLLLLGNYLMDLLVKMQNLK